jgi:hypothetical protein
MDAKKLAITLVGNDISSFDMFEAAFRELNECVDYYFAGNSSEGLEPIRARKPELLFISVDDKPAATLQFLSVIKSDGKLKSARVFLYGPCFEDDVCKLARMLGASGCIERTTCATTFMRELKAVLDPRLLPNFIYMSHSPVYPQTTSFVATDENYVGNIPEPPGAVVVAVNQ